MNEIPQDILDVTNKLVNDYVNPDVPRPDYRPTLRKMIAAALVAERQRVLNICAAEREWGDFHYDDVTVRIELGEQPRQIEGWNCPSSDEVSA